MDQELIKEFKSLVKKKDYPAASKLIPKVLTYEKYRAFCDRAENYYSAQGETVNAVFYSLANISASMLESRERDRDIAEVAAIQAQEHAEFMHLVCEDAKTSFDISSENAAVIFDEYLIMYVMKDLLS